MIELAPNLPETVDLTEAAILMNVHEKTVVEYINSGALPAGRPGRAYVMRRKDVLGLVDQIIARDTQERLKKSPKRLG